MAVGEAMGEQRLKSGGNNISDGESLRLANLSQLHVSNIPNITNTNKEINKVKEEEEGGAGRRGTKLNAYDRIAVVGVVGTHLLALFGPFCFSWEAFWLAVSLYHVAGLFGICFSYHRNLAHHSFKVPKWLEYFCAYCGAQALQGDPMTWVSNHRFHHQYTDTERDPHSPIAGFWHSHMSWIFNSGSIQDKGVRTVCLHHTTFFVNSAAHTWGSQAWKTNDLSRNNWWVAILTFGEGWHNNHHAFKYSARQGLEWWQIDVTWYVLSFLQAMGLVYDVKLPSQSQMEKLALNT
ncbi:Palmitoyl-monogalactosyldiacylglycerol delta-7 desaturase, chloroplastic [Linum perenne]